MQEDVECISEMKKRFYEKLFSKDTYYNSVLLTKENYNSIIKEIKRIKTFKKRESTRDYRLVERYDVLTIKGCERLINPLSDDEQSVRLYVHADELFDIIYSCHISMGHGGRDRMIRHLHTLYKNITRSQLKMFSEVCDICQRRCDKKDNVERMPALPSNFNNKCQMWFIDFQAQADGQFKFILVYQDDATKFEVLKPLASKRASEVAIILVDIFLLLGTPRILHLDNGKEKLFYNEITDTLRKMWPEIRLFEGKIRRPQGEEDDDQEERTNRKIKKKLTAWMVENETDKWSEGLRFVQFMRNRASHSGMKKSPYETVFGRSNKLALNSTVLPKGLLGSLDSQVPLIKKEFSSSMESLSGDEPLLKSLANVEAIIGADADADNDADVDVESPSNSKRSISQIKAELVKETEESSWRATKKLRNS